MARLDLLGAPEWIDERGRRYLPPTLASAPVAYVATATLRSRLTGTTVGSSAGQDTDASLPATGDRTEVSFSVDGADRARR